MELVPSAEKHADGGKHRKTCNRCQRREICGSAKCERIRVKYASIRFGFLIYKPLSLCTAAGGSLVPR